MVTDGRPARLQAGLCCARLHVMALNCPLPARAGPGITGDDLRGLLPWLPAPLSSALGTPPGEAAAAAAHAAAVPWGGSAGGKGGLLGAPPHDDARWGA